MIKTWIFPIAGNGMRTKALGEYKPFIEVKGKKIIEWFLQSIKGKIKPGDAVYFVTTENFEKLYNVTKTLKKIIGCEVIISKDTPVGPAKTISLALDKTPDESEVIICNSDQYISFDEKYCGDIGLVCNVDVGNSKSYFAVENGRVTDVKEKENISCIASAGVYMFKQAKLAKQNLAKLYESNMKTNGEYYIAPSINFSLDKEISLIPAKLKLDMGTVDNIKYFETHLENLID